MVELSNRRFAYVDLIRGLSALTVLICHYRWLFARDVNDWRADAPLPLYDWLWPIYEHGGIAVQMFWLLSGFVFCVAYGAKGRDISAREFWVHRVARLYPLHLATLVLVAALEAISLIVHGRLTIEPNFDIPHFVAQLFFASNWFTMEPSFNGPIWSVSIEVLIYFLFLFYMKRAGLSLAWAIGMAALAFSIDLSTNSPIAQCATLFFAGVAIGILTPLVQRRLGRKLLFLSLAGLACVIGLGFAVALAGHGIHVERIMIYVGTTALLAVFLSFDLHLRPLSPRFYWIGAITYAVYLLHMPMIIAVKIIVPDPPGLSSPLTLVAYVAVVILASLFVYRRFELPAQRYVRQRWAASPKAPSARLAEQAAP